MLSRRNLFELVSINNLISIECQSIFGLSRNARHRERQWLGLKMADLIGQRSSRKRAVERRGSETQGRAYGQHYGYQSNKSQFVFNDTATSEINTVDLHHPRQSNPTFA